MKTVVVACPKGGTGKTTVVAALAVRAAEEAGRVAAIDLNADQASLTQWWTLRGRTVNPYLMTEGGRLVEDVALLRADGWDWLFVDTPPGDMDLIETAVLVADAVIVPVRASFLDTSAIDAVIDMCKRRRKKLAFLFNAFDARAAFKGTNLEAQVALEGRGAVLKTRLPYHDGFIAGQIDGKTGPEMRKALKAPVDALWQEVKALAGAGRAMAAEKERTRHVH